MQATQTVRFDDKVRLTVESNICRESGPLPDCFQLPLQLVLQRMQQVGMSVVINVDELSMNFYGLPFSRGGRIWVAWV